MTNDNTTPKRSRIITFDNGYGHADLLTTIGDVAVNIATDISRDPCENWERPLFDAALDRTTRDTIETAFNVHRFALGRAAVRLGFGLGLTLATHAAHGYEAWLTAALQAIGEDVEVEPEVEFDLQPASVGQREYIAELAGRLGKRVDVDRLTAGRADAIIAWERSHQRDAPARPDNGMLRGAVKVVA